MKKEFILLALQPEANLRRLCGHYGISAACGYKWLRAYQEKGFAGSEPKSRRPHAHPDQTGAPMEREILSLRDDTQLGVDASSNVGSKIWGLSKYRRLAPLLRSSVATGG